MLGAWAKWRCRWQPLRVERCGVDSSEWCQRIDRPALAPELKRRRRKCTRWRLDWQWRRGLHSSAPLGNARQNMDLSWLAGTFPCTPPWEPTLSNRAPPPPLGANPNPTPTWERIGTCLTAVGQPCRRSQQNRRYWWLTDKFIRLSQSPLWFVRTEGIGTREKGGGGRGRGEGEKNPPPSPPRFPQFASVPHPGSLRCTHPRLSRFPNQDGGRDFSAGCSLIRLLCRLLPPWPWTWWKARK